MYRRTQFATVIVGSLLFAVVVLGALAYSTGWPLPFLLTDAVLLLVLLIFRSLTIDIDDRELRCWFGDGLIHRRFELADIVEARPVRNHWYYGWGIRLTPSGWMFNVSGLDAVELVLTNSKRFRIGTEDPGEVVEAIEQHKAGAGPS